MGVLIVSQIVISIFESIILYFFGELIKRNQDFLEYIGVKQKKYLEEDNEVLKKRIRIADILNSLGIMIQFYALIRVLFQILQIMTGISMMN